ncbi:DSS1 SEM1 family protein [Babesia ovata]|uniref:DSS1 SEM1 family protein n=1 Tax=Babesia ovata TaxID=189622 RepID=A0A2H6KF75_9APIC|nr:DSS1 SEM1 family protein [Babesia ovata]GBE61651.1 DSS1 SEM1 family protein [Babesia ovata]
MENENKDSIEIDEDVDMGGDMQIFDEPDDELEEFDEIDNVVTAEDPEISNWNDDWETAGWDDEDVESDFVKRILQELENYRKAYH